MKKNNTLIGVNCSQSARISKFRAIGLYRSLDWTGSCDIETRVPGSTILHACVYVCARAQSYILHHEHETASYQQKIPIAANW